MIAIFLDYLYWHFAIAPFEILKIMKNYQIANWHKFLIVQHFRTLFSPWHRQNPSDFGTRAKTFTDKILDSIVDFYIRLIAAGIRLMIIGMGLLMELVITLGFSLLFVVWLAWPLVAMYCIYSGFQMVIFNY